MHYRCLKLFSSPSILASVSCFLKHRADFVRVLKRGHSTRGCHWSLRCTPNGQGCPRLGIILAKRYVRTAVLRNQLRRQLREFFRQECQQTLPAMDFLVRAVVPIPASIQGGIVPEFQRLLKRIFHE